MLAAALALELTAPVATLGAITGIVYGALSVGLILVYRQDRVINFAYGQIGVVGAVMLAVACIEWGVPYWISLVGAILLGAVVGAACQFIVRPLRDAPLAITVVATLGLAQILSIAASVIQPASVTYTNYPTPPWMPTFDLGALHVSEAQTAMLVVTPILVLGLAAFLRRGRHGQAMRAAAANEDAAALAGIVGKRMSMQTWAIAGGIATFTAVLLLPGAGNYTGFDFLGPNLLLRAMACAAIARMSNLPVALAAGVCVGVVESVVRASYPTETGLIDVLLFVTIMVALLVQRSPVGRDGQGAAWTRVSSWAPLPTSYQSLLSVRRLRTAAIVVPVVVAALLPLWVSSHAALVLVGIASFALVGVSVGVVSGLSGQLSLGQFALAGVGGSVCVIASSRGMAPLAGFILGGMVAAASSMILALPALRIRGLMVAVTSLAFAIAAQSWVFRQDWMLGQGVSPARPTLGGVKFDTSKSYYYLTIVVLLLALLLTRQVWTGGVGRRLRSIRDNEAVARSFGVRAWSDKLLAFGLGGFLAGIGGALYASSLSRVDSVTFPVDASINVAAIAVVGGLGLIVGPLLGAIYVLGVPRFVPLDEAALAATSAAWLGLILLHPSGLGGRLVGVRDRICDGLARRAGLDPSVERSATSAPPALAAAKHVAMRDRHPVARSDQPILQAIEIHRRFGGVHALRGVSFDVAPGETVGLIGPNGAGKTTLFEVVSGFVAADRGRVVFDGHDVTKWSPERRSHEGLVRSFQDSELFPTLTVREVVALAVERRNPVGIVKVLDPIGRLERRRLQQADEIVDALGLGSWRNKQTRELSTGTRRIVELGCMVALEPRVLLLDEPSSGIAQRETEALGELLTRLRKDLDLTMVVVEHDVPLVMSISDRIIAMESGGVISVGPPAVVRADPAVVASYLGTDDDVLQRSDLSIAVSGEAVVTH